MRTTEADTEITVLLIMLCTIRPMMTAMAMKPARDAPAVVGIRFAMPDMRLMNTMTARDTTAAITWLSVREEMNIPMATSADPSRKNASREAYAVVKYTVPKEARIRGYRPMTAQGTNRTVTIARYFAMTMEEIFMGRE